MKIRNLLEQKLSNIFSNKKNNLNKEEFIPYGKQLISQDDINRGTVHQEAPKDTVFSPVNEKKNKNEK